MFEFLRRNNMFFKRYCDMMFVMKAILINSMKHYMHGFLDLKGFILYFLGAWNNLCG
jgi:hypothetical protein